MWKEALGSLLRRRYNIYSVSPGIAPLRLLSSHSSALMLNFQNFYITKGPTTSAEKYPASTKSARQPRPCRGETLAFRQLPPAVAPRGESAEEKEEEEGDFPISAAFPEDFNPFSLSLARPAERRGGRRRRERRRKKKPHRLYYLEEEQCQRPSLDSSTMQRYRLIYLH